MRWQQAPNQPPALSASDSFTDGVLRILIMKTFFFFSEWMPFNCTWQDMVWFLSKKGLSAMQWTVWWWWWWNLKSSQHPRASHEWSTHLETCIHMRLNHRGCKRKTVHFYSLVDFPPGSYSWSNVFETSSFPKLKPLHLVVILNSMAVGVYRFSNLFSMVSLLHL